jgi:hypothetical protein
MVRARAEFFGSKIGARFAEPFVTATSRVRFGWVAGLPGQK